MAFTSHCCFCSYTNSQREGHVYLNDHVTLLKKLTALMSLEMCSKSTSFTSEGFLFTTFAMSSPSLPRGAESLTKWAGLMQTPTRRGMDSSSSEAKEASVLPKDTDGQETLLREARGSTSLADRAGDFIDRHLRLFKVSATDKTSVS